MATKLKLEKRNQIDHTTYIEGQKEVTMFAPIVNEEYWLYRVKLFRDQAVIAFPKFGIIGIGFAKETDWNTNLPSACPAEQICEHIYRNKKYDKITEEQVVEAIKMIQEQVLLDMAPEKVAARKELELEFRRLYGEMKGSI